MVSVSGEGRVLRDDGEGEGGEEVEAQTVQNHIRNVPFTFGHSDLRWWWDYL